MKKITTPLRNRELLNLLKEGQTVTIKGLFLRPAKRSVGNTEQFLLNGKFYVYAENSEEVQEAELLWFDGMPEHTLELGTFLSIVVTKTETGELMAVYNTLSIQTAIDSLNI